LIRLNETITLLLHRIHLRDLDWYQNIRKKDSWIESREYPGSRIQVIISILIFILASVAFINFSTVDTSISTTFYAIFTSLAFSITIFPRYLEFSTVSGELYSQGMAKVKPQNGLSRFMPMLSLALIFLVLPIMIMLITPALIWSSITGILTGFSIQRLTFFIFFKNWSRSRHLKITRYSIRAKNELGKQVVLEHGLKAEKI
jgi:hypothetical protein